MPKPQCWFIPSSFVDHCVDVAMTLFDLTAWCSGKTAPGVMVCPLVVYSVVSLAVHRGWPPQSMRTGGLEIDVPASSLDVGYDGPEQVLQQSIYLQQVCSEQHHFGCSGGCSRVQTLSWGHQREWLFHGRAKSSTHACVSSRHAHRAPLQLPLRAANGCSKPVLQWLISRGGGCYTGIWDFVRRLLLYHLTHRNA